MTATQFPPYVTAAIDAIASTVRVACENGDAEITELFEAVVQRLAGENELCPMHGCDYRICADDEVLECAEARG